jgi:hypothetical protein
MGSLMIVGGMPRPHCQGSLGCLVVRATVAFDYARAVSQCAQEAWHTVIAEYRAADHLACRPFPSRFCGE